MVVTVAIVLVTMSDAAAELQLQTCPGSGLQLFATRAKCWPDRYLGASPSLSDSSLSESSQGDDYDLVFADDFDNDLFTNRSDDEDNNDYPGLCRSPVSILRDITPDELAAGSSLAILLTQFEKMLLCLPDDIRNLVDELRATLLPYFPEPLFPCRRIADAVESIAVDRFRDKVVGEVAHLLAMIPAVPTEPGQDDADPSDLGVLPLLLLGMVIDRALPGASLADDDRSVHDTSVPYRILALPDDVDAPFRIVTLWSGDDAPHRFFQFAHDVAVLHRFFHWDQPVQQVTALRSNSDWA